uniref:Uncharacterized protein n=1 Tax=Graphocephala atropunctata TaxID=36148 RepID=A0A1B6LB64_9HEMI
MNPWTLFLFVVGAVSAHHGQYHHLQGTALGYSAAPHVNLQPSYAVPVQVYTAAPAPALQVYSAPLVAAPAPLLPAPVYSAPPYPAAVRPYVALPKYQAPVRPVSPPAYTRQYVRPVAILRQSQDDNFDGSFSYDFQTENGISAQARGHLKNPGTTAEAQVIQGQFSYTAPDGTPITTRYYADDTGFHAEGAHLPVPPPIPEAITRSLAYHKSPLYN